MKPKKFNMRPVQSITIQIEWKKSRVWGRNPHAVASVAFHDGTFEMSKTYKASGCGYDKASTVVADIFNEYLKYKLLEPGLPAERPYGVHVNEKFAFFDGGIGISAYRAISEYIGGKWHEVANGTNFDVYTWTDWSGRADAQRADSPLNNPSAER